jgi:hypothetical protein
VKGPLHVALPLGIGDCHWVCTKLRALSARHGGRPIWAHVNRSPSHVSVGYLELVPAVARAIEDARAPADIGRELPPSHRDPRWSDLDGCRGWNGFDYVLVANGHLESGGSLADWLPELETDFCYPLRIPDAARARARALAAPGGVLLYLSGVGPNRGFHNDTWTADMWAQVVHLLNGAGIEPTLVGAATTDDRAYRDAFVARAGGHARFVDRVGQTSIAEVCALLEGAGAWVGLNSGLGIVAAMRGVPTVMLWSDSEHPIAGTVEPLHTAMRRSWLRPDQCGRYRTLSFGSPELTPTRVVARTLEVLRG